MNGYIHSVETCGTLDGPGLRYVVFMQGCPLRCRFCHNPDTWQCNKGSKLSPEEVMEDIVKYSSFIKKGGVTLSGGEPLAQAGFSAELLRLCRKEGIHTAIDTSGAVPLNLCRHAVDEARLILLDIKHINDDKCRELTGQGNENALELLDYCQWKNKKVWIRHVIIPGITDDERDIEAMAEYLSGITAIKRIEVLPFHKMGEFKWKELGLHYELENTPEPAASSIESIRRIFRKYSLNAA